MLRGLLLALCLLFGIAGCSTTGLLSKTAGAVLGGDSQGISVDAQVGDRDNALEVDKQEVNVGDVSGTSIIESSETKVEGEQNNIEISPLIAAMLLFLLFVPTPLYGAMDLYKDYKKWKNE